MARVSIIGTGNMGQAIASVVTKGGNTDTSHPVDRIDPYHAPTVCRIRESPHQTRDCHHVP